MSNRNLACPGCGRGYKVHPAIADPTCRTCGKRLVDTQSIKARRREERRQRAEWLRQVEGDDPPKNHR